MICSRIILAAQGHGTRSKRRCTGSFYITRYVTRNDPTLCHGAPRATRRARAHARTHHAARRRCSCTLLLMRLIWYPKREWYPQLVPQKGLVPPPTVDTRRLKRGWRPPPTADSAPKKGLAPPQHRTQKGLVQPNPTVSFSKLARLFRCTPARRPMYTRQAEMADPKTPRPSDVEFDNGYYTNPKYASTVWYIGGPPQGSVQTDHTSCSRTTTATSAGRQVHRRHCRRP